MSLNQSESRKNKRRATLTLAIAALVTLLTTVCASAHTPLLYIEDNEDGTIYIEGGFSDGSSAAGIAVRIEDADGNTLWEGVLGDFGSVESAPIPDVRPYYVMFDAGPGHMVTKEGIYPPTAVDPGDVAPSNDAQNEPVTPFVSVTPATSVPAVTPMPPNAESTSPQASVASSSAWTPDTTTTSVQESGPTNSVLWVMVALLSFIALMLLILCGGVLFLIGWMVGRGRQR